MESNSWFMSDGGKPEFFWDGIEMLIPRVFDGGKTNEQVLNELRQCVIQWNPVSDEEHELKDSLLLGLDDLIDIAMCQLELEREQLGSEVENWLYRQSEA